MIVLDPRLDTSDPFGYFLFVILAAAAELESTQIMERTMGGRMEMLGQTSTARLPAKRGGRKARYGLRYVPAQEPGERDRWERHPEEARWVLYIHTQMAAEHSAESVARDLNRRGVAGPEGGVWHAATVRQIVHADCYCGTMTRRLGGQEITFPVEEIVSEPLRQRARAQLARNKERSPRNTKYEYLLAGTRSEPLLVCRTCWRAGEEHIMGGRTDHRRAARGWQARWYECKHGHAGADVRHRVAAARLEEAVWAAICEMVQDPETVLARFERLADAASAEAREIEEEISRLAERQAENRLAQQRLLECAVRGQLAADLIGAQEDALEAEAHDLAVRRALLEVQLELARAGQAPLGEVRDALGLLADGLLEAAFEDKKWIIRQLVTRIRADRHGSELEGFLPGLRAEGTYGTGASIERTPMSITGRHGGASALSVGMVPFVRFFPQQGTAETRVLTSRGHPVLPDDEYALLESFCTDPGCDCRRVMLNVISRRQQGVVARINGLGLRACR
jgi:hypothetical protein